MKYVKIFIGILSTCSFELVDASSKKNPTHLAFTRDKRSLVFPADSQLLLIFGLGTPLQLERESVIVGAFSKIIYGMPSNSSGIAGPFSSAESRLGYGNSRWSLYKKLADLAELYGFADGRACVLRAICEVASTPFDAHHGLLAQLLQLFFSPSSTPPEPYEDYGDQEYEAAERLGSREAKACHSSFLRDCPRSFLDIFSRLAQAF